ncbi:MAG: competence/damage-inducible protein A [Alphaproteobacteria bacterium]
MKVEIISIGAELLIGRILDTNTAYLSAELQEIGCEVCRHTTVGDNRRDILDAIKAATGRAEVVIITGGLGPTRDDLTREVVAEFCGAPLVENAAAAENLRRRFSRRGPAMPTNNLAQAYIPRRSEPIHNPRGTAVGFMVRKGPCELVVMPGVPAEMKAMFETTVRPRLAERVQGVTRMRHLRCFGIGESLLGEKLGDLMREDANPRVGTQVHGGIIAVRLVAKAATKADADALLDASVAEVRARLGGEVYSDADETLAENVAALLQRRGDTLAVAESCTGGLICDMLTDVPGVSRCFLSGYVCYSNEAKIRELKVPAELIEQHGAVSREVAEALARGARRESGADFGLAVTGLAGPTGATETKPIGLVYISLADARHVVTETIRLHQDRRTIKDRAAKHALNLLRRRLIGADRKRKE